MDDYEERNRWVCGQVWSSLTSKGGTISLLCHVANQLVTCDIIIFM